MANFIPRQLSEAEIEELQNEFTVKEADIEQAEQMFKEMDDYFRNADIKTDKDFSLSYFRWYTDLSWKFLQSRDYDFVVNVAVARQIPPAILLGFDVWQDLIWYLALRAELKSDMESLYGRIREAFVKSEAIIGIWQGSDYKVSDLVKEMQMLERLGNDSIEEAEFRNKSLQIYMPENNATLQKYIMVDPSDGLASLISIVSFFLGVEPVNIWYVVDNYTHPEIVGEASPSAKPVVVAAPKPAPVKPTPQPQAVQPKKEEVKPISPPAVPARPTPAQIKSQIEKEFSAEDVEGIMGKLNELAEKNNDPKIADMYYFDEKTARFLWNQ